MTRNSSQSATGKRTGYSSNRTARAASSRSVTAGPPSSRGADSATRLPAGSSFSAGIHGWRRRRGGPGSDRTAWPRRLRGASASPGTSRASSAIKRHSSRRRGPHPGRPPRGRCRRTSPQVLRASGSAVPIGWKGCWLAHWPGQCPWRLRPGQTGYTPGPSPGTCGGPPGCARGGPGHPPS